MSRGSCVAIAPTVHLKQKDEGHGIAAPFSFLTLRASQTERL
ncbi:MAG: hypothetical protein WBA57_25275 [Elainellaceae cyanobacterium]